MKLTIEHLKAGYDNAVIIDDLNLAIPEGKITALIGANGCGKSTLLKTICRIRPSLGG
ncbi:MAG: ATP-binding cassette domain-containing protein, partial [Selenomonas massiliensis]